MSAPAHLTATQAAIVAECDALRDLLLRKNRLYGNSALEPAGVFARGSALQQIAVRLDDKLNRIRNLGGLEAVLGERAPDGEDTVMDLLGYLVLARLAAAQAPKTLTAPRAPIPVPMRDEASLADTLARAVAAEK